MNSSQLKDKWNSRYQESDIGDSSPAQVLQENLHLLPASGHALDLACGLGSNAILLAQNGLSVFAWDISAVAIDKLDRYAKAQHLNINTQVHDIESSPPEKNRFDVIVIAHFLERNLSAAIVDALKPEGMLFYQTFTRTKVSDQGPANPEYRLADNELLSMFPGLQILLYREEGITGDISKGFRDQAILVAKKR